MWLPRLVCLILVCASRLVFAQEPGPVREYPTPSTSTIPVAAPAVQKLLPVPLPNLSAAEPTVKAQVEKAWVELKAVSENRKSTEGQGARAYGETGMIFHAYGFFDSASACYHNAHALDPKEFAWPYYLGVIYQVNGDVKKAVVYLEKAEEIRAKQVPVLVHLGQAYLADGKSESAKRSFESALSSDRSSAAALAGLGTISLSQHDFSAAISSLKKALELQPEATSLHYQLGLAYRGSGDVTNAVTQLGERGPGNPKIADPWMDDLDDLKHGQALLWARGSAALREGRFAEAVKLFNEMVVQAPEDPLPRLYLGNAFAQGGNLKEAAKEYVDVLRRSPTNATAHYNLGVVFLELKESDKAIEQFQIAVTLDPSFTSCRFQLANLLIRAGHYQEAILHYSEVIRLHPDDEFARLMKSMALIRLRRYGEAKAELEESVASLPESIDLASTLARLLAACPQRSLRDGPRALSMSEKLIKYHASSDIEIFETYGMALACTGRFHQAAELQRRIIIAAEEAKMFDLANVLKQNLSLYEQNKPCMTPWREDDPIFSPQPGKMVVMRPP